MAVLRFKEKPKTFDFEGMTIGVRQPTTKEILEITRQRQAYIKSVHEDPYKDGEGEITLFLDLQLNTSRLLACDPDDSQSPWFAADSEEQKRLEKSGVLRDMAEEVPHKLHSALWFVLTGGDGNAPLEKPEKEKKAMTESSETTSDSTPLSFESPSTSDAESPTLSNGNGADSSTDLNA